MDWVTKALTVINFKNIDATMFSGKSDTCKAKLGTKLI